MELTYKGGNCIVLTIKKDQFVFDGRLSALGLKDVVPKEAVQIATQSELLPNKLLTDSITIDGPGEYEVRNVSLKGVSTRRMIDADGQATTMYRVSTGGIVIAVIGHIHAPIEESDLEALGIVDIVVVPVGGNGYTLDAHQAADVVAQIEPKVVIPTHYADSALSYEVPQHDVDEFIKEMGGTHEKLTSLKLKTDSLPASLTVIELTRS